MCPENFRGHRAGFSIYILQVGCRCSAHPISVTQLDMMTVHKTPWERSNQCKILYSCVSHEITLYTLRTRQCIWSMWNLDQYGSYSVLHVVDMMSACGGFSFPKIKIYIFWTLFEIIFNLNHGVPSSECYPCWCWPWWVWQHLSQASDHGLPFTKRDMR